MLELIIGFLLGMLFGASVTLAGIKEKIKSNLKPYLSKNNSLEWERKE